MRLNSLSHHCSMTARFTAPFLIIGWTTLVGSIGFVSGSLGSGPTLSPLVSLSRFCRSWYPRAADAPFVSNINHSMDVMMAAMAVPSSGNVDRDFVATMIPHHEGAIAMSVALLRYGRNESLKRMAQEIIVTQQQEIAAMRLATRGQP